MRYITDVMERVKKVTTGVPFFPIKPIGLVGIRRDTLICPPEKSCDGVAAHRHRLRPGVGRRHHGHAYQTRPRTSEFFWEENAPYRGAKGVRNFFGERLCLLGRKRRAKNFLGKISAIGAVSCWRASLICGEVEAKGSGCRQLPRQSG